MTLTFMAPASYDKCMPKGVYKRSEAQLEALRKQAKKAGASGSPSEAARERMSEERTRHGHSKRTGSSKTYECWRNMLNRCQNPNVPAYKNYGGRGIAVCQRWLRFENFLADMGERPAGMTIERIDNDGNYEPGNVRWATYKEQTRNNRSTQLVTLHGETKCITDWAAETGIKMPTLWARLRLGWSVEDALTKPVRGRRQ